jgi:hypothetical protein
MRPTGCRGDREHLARDPMLALDGLVGIGIHADHDGLAVIAGLGELRAQDLRGVGLRGEARFPIDTRRETQVGVAGTGVAVWATYAASAIWIERL